MYLLVFALYDDWNIGPAFHSFEAAVAKRDELNAKEQPWSKCWQVWDVEVEDGTDKQS